MQKNLIQLIKSLCLPSLPDIHTNGGLVLTQQKLQHNTDSMLTSKDADSILQELSTLICSAGHISPKLLNCFVRIDNFHASGSFSAWFKIMETILFWRHLRGLSPYLTWLLCEKEWKIGVWGHYRYPQWNTLLSLLSVRPTLRWTNVF